MANHFFSGGTSISGAQLASTIANMASLGGIGHHVLKEFGIAEIDPQKDYPFEIRRSIHATVLKRFGPDALYSFGFAYGDSWTHIHDTLHALRMTHHDRNPGATPWLSTEQAIDTIGHKAFELMHELLEKNSHGDIYYGAWFKKLGEGLYRAEMRNTSSLSQEAFPHGLFINFFWSYLSDHWSFKVIFEPELTTHGPEWTHFVWTLEFTPCLSDKSAQELTWEHRLAAREALLGRVLAESEQKHQLVMESMNYARLLQEAQLPRPFRYARCAEEFGVLWEPRDTIGGDFWWISPATGDAPFTLFVVDCAGHGVPGAMLALLASTTLESIYAAGEAVSPGMALQKLGNALRRGLNQDQPLVSGEVSHDDGCDAAALQIHRSTGQAIFAGANLSMLHLPAKAPLYRVKGDAMRLGYRDAEDAMPREQPVQFSAGDRFVLATDGVVDQVGHVAGRTPMAFGHRRLMQLLETHRHLSPQSVMDELKKSLQQWQADGLRRDDVTAICVAV